MKLLYLTTNLPALTLTFIYREIFELRRLGFDIDTVSMNRPETHRVSPEAHELLDSTLYLDRVSLAKKLVAPFLVLAHRPAALLRCFLIIVRSLPMPPGFFIRLVYHLFESCVVYLDLRKHPPQHIHSHFVSGPTSLAMFIAELCGSTFSFTIHGSNLWLDPMALDAKLEKCRFCISISGYMRDYVITEYGEKFRDKIHIVHCGIYPTTRTEAIVRSDTSNEKPVHILAVGQLTARKGFSVLVDACHILKSRGISFYCTIIGGGELHQDLEEQIRQSGLEHCVQLAGPLPQEEVQKFYQSTDIFVLPSIVAKDLTREGIPVVLMEAMAWSIPSISTETVGIPELITPGQEGLLVPPEKPELLADALEQLVCAPDQRRKIGNAGREKVLRDFNIQKSAGQLATLFRGTSC